MTDRGGRGVRDGTRQGTLKATICALIGCAAGLLASPSLQAQWDITPSITAGVTYTDNVELEREQPQAEAVTLLAPAVRARIDGQRLDADVNYRLESYFYGNESDRDQTFHILNSNATLNVVRESLFVDMNASANRQIIDSREPVARNNVAVSTNTADVTTVGVSPYWRARVGVLGNMLTRYEHARTAYLDRDTQGGVPDDLTRDSFLYTLGTLGGEGRVTWGFAYEADRVEFDSGTVDEIEEASIEGNYRMGPNITLIALVGEERNNFARVDTNRTSGTFWQAGVRWGLGVSDVLEYRTGERFFGTTNSLIWLHTGRALSSDVSYTEEVSDATRVELVDDPLQGGGVQQVSDDVFVTRRLDAALNWRRPRSGYGLAVGGERRERQRAGTTDEALAVTTFVDWRPRPRTTLTLRVGARWERFEEEGTREDRLTYTDFEMRQDLSTRTSITGTLSHTESDSGDPARGYTENLASLRVTRSF